MSYILDALRKADAQRVGSPARGIHAHATHATLGPAGTRRPTQQWLWGSVAALAVVAGAWVWSSANNIAPPAPSLAAPRIEAEGTAPAAVAVLPAAPPVAATPRPVIVPPPPVAAEPEVRHAQPRVPGKEPPPAAARPVQQPAAAASPAPVTAAAAPERTYALAELPADVQQALPKLSISGGVYSENVAQRMLVVNGQVFNEGSEVAPGVVLEQIRARIALLRFRGLRFTQPY